jgi:hypothetical protein
MRHTLRLYQITDTVTKTTVPEAFFTCKKDAVLARRELNEVLGPSILRYVVSPGPDNKHYKA